MAHTVCRMIEYSALSIDAAHGSRAWALAMFVDASLIAGTIRVDDALRSTSALRIAQMVWQATANGTIIQYMTFGVDTAWIWYTWRALWFVGSIAIRQWIADKTMITEAHWMVFFHFAMCIYTARAGAWIATSET